MESVHAPVTVVTGATGFLASHIVAQLLEQGHVVRATVRNPESSSCSHLRAFPGAAERLQLYPADLLEPDSFDDAINGAENVIHTASPFHTGKVEDGEAEFIKPAVDGALNVLKAIRRSKESVKAIVLTSSTFAMAPQPEPEVKSEADWSDAELQKSREQWYGASKTLAEQAAFKYMEDWALSTQMSSDPVPTFATIQPTGIVGPSLGNGPLGASMQWISKLLKNGMPDGITNGSMSFIDVRDCAALHIAALGNEGRFMAVSASWHWKDILAEFKKYHPAMPDSPEFKGDAQKPSSFDFTRMQSLGVPIRTLPEIFEGVIEYLRQRGDL